MPASPKKKIRARARVFRRPLDLPAGASKEIRDKGFHCLATMRWMVDGRLVHRHHRSFY
jgi:hypothetical protein